MFLILLVAWTKDFKIITKNLKTLPSCPHLVRCVIKLLLFVRKDHEKAEFEVHEVYAVDVLISTGEGKVSISLCCGYSWIQLLTVCMLQQTRVLSQEQTAKVVYACLLYWIRPETEAWGPPFTRGTPASSTAWRWKHPVCSSAKWNAASTQCHLLSGMDASRKVKILKY